MARRPLQYLRAYCESYGASGDETDFRGQILKDIEGAVDEVSVNPVGNLIAEKRGRDDTRCILVTAHMDDGSLAMLSGTRQDPLGYDIRMEVFGTGDSVAVGMDPHTPIRSLEPGAPPPAEPVTTGWLERFEDAYRAEMDAFVDVARGRRPSPCTPEDARAALVIAEACGRSAREGRPVPVGGARSDGGR